MSDFLPIMVLNRENILELIKYREIIEVGAVALAVERSDDTDIRALEENLQKHEHFQNDYMKVAKIGFRISSPHCESFKKSVCDQSQ